MRKQLYLDIKNHLRIIEDEAGEPLFRHFDLWNSQVELIEQTTLFASPAVFMEFVQMNWEMNGNRIQTCELTFRLHVVNKCREENSGYSSTEEQMLNFFDITDRLVTEMQHFKPDYLTCLARSRSITNHDHKRLVDNVEEYICNLRDISAVPQYVEVMPSFSINKKSLE